MRVKDLTARAAFKAKYVAFGSGMGITGLAVSQVCRGSCGNCYACVGGVGVALLALAAFWRNKADQNNQVVEGAVATEEMKSDAKL